MHGLHISCHEEWEQPILCHNDLRVWGGHLISLNDLEEFHFYLGNKPYAMRTYLLDLLLRKHA